MSRARWRAVQTWAAVGAIVIGYGIAAHFSDDAKTKHLPRYTYGDRGPAVDTVKDALPAALRADAWFTVGYGLLLGGFAVIFWVWAFSSIGRLVARFVLVAVGIAVVADWVRFVLLYQTLHYTADPAKTRLIYATSAVATIKGCALILSLVGVAATVGIVFRGAATWIKLYVIQRSRRNDRRFEWWNAVLASPDLPELQAADSLSEEEWSWVEAYNVPGAKDVIKGRGDKPVQAVCLSGGGVRSACVAMGTMQILSESDPLDPRDRGKPNDPGKPAPRLIDCVDYVISVSGGGYSAGARLLAVQPPGGQSVGAAPQPSQTAAQEPLLSQRFQEGSPEFDHFRRHSSYIAESPAEMIRALAEVLKNLLASMAILLTLPAMLGWIVGYLLARPAFSFAAIVPVPNPGLDSIKQQHPDYLLSLIPHPASWLAVLFFVVWTVVFVVAALVIEAFSSGEHSEKWNLRMLRYAQGSAVFALLVLVIVAGMPGLMRLCSTLGQHAAGNRGGTAVAVTGVVGLNYVAAIAAMAWKKRSALPIGALTQPSWWKRLLPPAVLQLILVLVTLAVLLVVWLITLGSFAAGVFRQVTLEGYEETVRQVPQGLVLFGLALTTVLMGFVDVTSLSLHPFYRFRLARTFAVRRVRIPMAGGWCAERYERTEWTWLPKYGHVPGGRPRFLFAGAAALSGEAKPAPGLNAVSYVMGADYIGSPALGWLRTTQLFEKAPARIKRDLTVLAAVAVSGAAFASAMGRQNKGFQKLLAVSGARLGTWLPNPRFVAKLASAQEQDSAAEQDDDSRPWPKSLPTIRGASYFYRELLGFNYDDARLVQVTDGGHYENLGLVEALRRRCRLIFCVDGGGDVPPLLSGLSDAMRLAKYELGVTITLDTDGPYSVDNVAPGSGTPFGEGHALASLNSRLTKGTVVAGRIEYPPAAGLANPDGLLIVAKAVLWQGCPEWLLTYAASSSAFPHDPTSDQWFNEGQFAAYTALGRIMGKQAMECAEAMQGAGLIGNGPGVAPGRPGDYSGA